MGTGADEVVVAVLELVPDGTACTIASKERKRRPDLGSIVYCKMEH